MRIVAVYVKTSGHVLAGYVESDPAGTEPTVESVVGTELQRVVVTSDLTAEIVSFAAAELAIATSSDPNLTSEPITNLLVTSTGGTPALAKATPIAEGGVSWTIIDDRLVITIDSPPSTPISGLRLRKPGENSSHQVLPDNGEVDLGATTAGLLLIPVYPVISVGDLWPTSSSGVVTFT